MKKKLKINKLYKKIIFLAIFAYVLCTLVKQEKTLNEYKVSTKDYEEKLAVQQAYQEELNNKKLNINSKEYIEEVAREKLDMYLPNEKVYIDK